MVASFPVGPGWVVEMSIVYVSLYCTVFRMRYDVVWMIDA